MKRFAFTSRLAAALAVIVTATPVMADNNALYEHPLRMTDTAIFADIWPNASPHHSGAVSAQHPWGFGPHSLSGVTMAECFMSPPDPLVSDTAQGSTTLIFQRW